MINPFSSMSSTGQATSPFENVKLIIDALADYAKETGVDLSKNPFAAKLEQLMSPEDILQLLEEREKAFKEYREGNRRLTNFLLTRQSRFFTDSRGSLAMRLAW